MKRTVIDVGCGTGNYLLPYYQRGFHVVGIDLDQENIEACKAKMPEGEFSVGDACTVDLSSYTNVDLVLCTEVLEHIPDWQRAVAALSTVKHGRLRITVPIEQSERKLLVLRPNYWKEIGHHHFFSGKEIAAELEQQGWSNINVTRRNAALYFELKALFNRNAPCIRNTYYENVLPLWLRLFFQLFRKDLFQTKLRYIPLWIVTLPIGMLLDRFYGAGISVTANKE